MTRVQVTIENVEIENWQADKYAALMAKVTLRMEDLTAGKPIQDCVFTVPVAQFQEQIDQERRDLVMEIASQHAQRCFGASEAVDPQTGTWDVGTAYIGTQFILEV